LLHKRAFLTHFATNQQRTTQPRLAGVDSSGPAVRLAEANAAANGLSGRAAFFRDDAGAYMAAAAERGDAWDVVVLDPPKLAPSRCVFGGFRCLYAVLVVLASARACS
jgi:23S rRNA G2069 N7-methylase RlmK/C1962 C5-methylase RlmI